MTAAGNLFRHVPSRLSEEEILPILETGSVRIERIVSMGHASPEGFWYEQEENEWVLVLQGNGIVEYEDGSSVGMTKGDWLNIPAGTRHRVRETSPDEPTVWLAVFYRRFS